MREAELAAEEASAAGSRCSGVEIECCRHVTQPLPAPLVLACHPGHVALATYPASALASFWSFPCRPSVGVPPTLTTHSRAPWKALATRLAEVAFYVETPRRPRELSSLSHEEVGCVLYNSELTEFVADFADAAIDGPMLGLIEESDLTGLGSFNASQRKRFLRLVARLESDGVPASLLKPPR